MNLNFIKNIGFVILNGLLIAFWAHRAISLNGAIKLFSLNPRNRPPFDFVFFYQKKLQTAIAIGQFLRTLHLIDALAGLNSIKGSSGRHLFRVLLKLKCLPILATMEVMKKLVVKMVGWLFFMVPFTAAFGLVGMALMNTSRLAAINYFLCYLH